MARGIERREIFFTDADREDLLDRLAQLAPDTGTAILAWSLMPNHFHLLLRSGKDGLSTFMRRLQTGYAGSFNRRHRRAGHLFQNRFKSVLVEEDPYFLELVRYIHLNPVRAGLVQGLRGLDAFAWSGHAVLMARREALWQDVDEVLERFGAETDAARAAYQRFVAEGFRQGRRPELSGGGLVRSIGGIEEFAEFRRGRERWQSDERVLGSSEFVKRVKDEVDERVAEHRRIRPEDREGFLGRLAVRIAMEFGLPAEELLGGSRRREVVAGRYALGTVAVTAGIPAAVVARTANVRIQSVLRGIKRGRELLSEKNVEIAELVQQCE